MRLRPLVAALFALAPAVHAEPPPARFTFLAHAGVGGYSLSLADANGAAGSRAVAVGGGAVATRTLLPSFGVGALAEVTGFLPDSGGSPATVGLLLGPAATFRAGPAVLTGSAALSLLDNGYGAGLGLLGAADLLLGGPVSLHGQVSFRDAFPSGGRVSFLAFALGLGLVY